MIAAGGIRISRVTIDWTISTAFCLLMPMPVITTRSFVSLGLVPLTGSLVMKAAYQPSPNDVTGISGTSSSYPVNPVTLPRTS